MVISVEDQTPESVNIVLAKFFNSITPEKIKDKLVILYEHRFRLSG